MANSIDNDFIQGILFNGTDFDDIVNDIDPSEFGDAVDTATRFIAGGGVDGLIIDNIGKSGFVTIAVNNPDEIRILGGNVVALGDNTQALVFLSGANPYDVSRSFSLQDVEFVDLGFQNIPNTNINVEALVGFPNVFNEAAYLIANPDINAAVQNGTIPSGLNHFVEFGIIEGRRPYFVNDPSIVTDPNEFDNIRYLSENPEVAAAVEAGAFTSGYDHYLRFGASEGRQGYIFNEQLYLLENPDVAAAVAAGGLSSGRAHYELFGLSEGRTTGHFDEVAYLLNNTDVAVALYSQDISGATEHYITSGRNEGRTPFFLT